jgi:hypothetical protein
MITNLRHKSMEPTDTVYSNLIGSPDFHPYIHEQFIDLPKEDCTLISELERDDYDNSEVVLKLD